MSTAGEEVFFFRGDASMKHGFCSRKRGFTMIEILAVFAIMAVIASLIAAAAIGARRKADSDAARSGVMYISNQIQSYLTKRGELPLNSGGAAATEVDIYTRLAEWNFAVPAKKQIDPWGNPYIIILYDDYGATFSITGGPDYQNPPFNKVASMYMTAADMPKDIRRGDPTTTDPYLNTYQAYQVISAGPDGLISRDGREETTDIDSDGKSVNADNFTNW
jgi:prepilin-type N-terminal cleavage/methylation domain-containing protein